MHKGLLAAAAVITLLGCGGSNSTGPGGNTAKNYTVTVRSTGFDPETVTVAPRDTVTWTVPGGEGTHNVTFSGHSNPTDLPSSGPVAEGTSVHTVFLTTGTYTYSDSVTANTGVVIVH